MSGGPCGHCCHSLSSSIPSGTSNTIRLPRTPRFVSSPDVLPELQTHAAKSLLNTPARVASWPLGASTRAPSGHPLKPAVSRTCSSHYPPQLRRGQVHPSRCSGPKSGITLDTSFSYIRPSASPDGTTFKPIQNPVTSQPLSEPPLPPECCGARGRRVSLLASSAPPSCSPHGHQRVPAVI